MFSILFFISENAFSQGCPVPIYTQNIEDLNRLIEKGQCNPLDKSTWAAEWKTPCECITQKNLYKKLNDKNPEEESKKWMTSVQLEMEKKIAESVREQLYSQFEQAVRLDIYIKKNIITTTNNINNTKLGSDYKVSIPTNCRLSKVGELIKELDVAAKNKTFASCNPENMKRRLETIFPDKSFEEWEKKQRAVIEKTAMNQLDKKEIESGMCVPYKSFLSLNNKTSLRSTYLRVAKAFGNDYLGFQNWMEDRSNDSYVHIAKLIKKDNENLATVVDSLKKDPNSGVDDISAEDIQKLLKTDPLFERMAHDPQFYKKIINTDSSVGENDPRLIKAIAESQDKSCSNLYGGGIVEVKDAKEGAEKIVLKDQNILTQFLCDEDFPKKFIDNKFIKNKMAPSLKTKLNLTSIDDAEYISADYLYCREKIPKEIPADYIKIDPWDVTTIRSDNLPASEPLKNLFNPILNPDSDLLSSESKSENLHKKFNQSFCPYVPENCRKLTATDAKCSLSNIAVEATQKLLDQKMQTDLTNESSKKLREDLDKLMNDPKVSDKELKTKLFELKKLSGEEVNLLITLREQTPTFIKLNAEKELRSVLGLDKDTKIDEAFIKTLENNPKVSVDLKDRIRGTGEKDNLLGESIRDEKASYFSNYYALASKDDEEKNKKEASYERKSFKIEEDSTPEAPPEAPPAETPKPSDDKKKETPPTTPAPASASPEKSGEKDDPKENGKNKNQQDDQEEDYEPEVSSKKKSSTSSNKGLANNADQMRKAQKKLDDLKKQTEEMENNEDHENIEEESSGADINRSEGQLNRKRALIPKKRQSKALPSTYNDQENNSFVIAGLNYKQAVPIKKKSNEENKVNPYDPFNRAPVAAPVNENKSTAANVSNEKAPPKGGSISSGGGSSSGGSSSSSGASSGSPSVKAPQASSSGGSNQSAEDTSEVDPDDLCGHDQELQCLFEYASIDMLSPSVQRFVEDLQLQGRSFRAVEVIRPADSKRAVKYFVHYFEPNVNLSVDDKEKIFRESKKLSKNYRKNKNALKELSKTVVEVRKVEITKEEAQGLTDLILKIGDLNKLSDRRARMR